jgi:hypothetical protein
MLPELLFLFLSFPQGKALIRSPGRSPDTERQERDLAIRAALGPPRSDRLPVQQAGFSPFSGL